MPELEREALAAAVRTDQPGLVASIRVLEAVPYLFAGDARACIEWKERLATAIGVNSRSVVVVGSAAAGFSLSPHKNLAAFSDDSDVDVAVVSAHHFDVGWRWLRSLGAERYRYPGYIQRWIEDHRTRLVYYGAIATDKLLPYMPFGPAWVQATAPLAAAVPISGREVNIRLYRDNESLAGYQTHSITKLRDRLLSSPSSKI